MDRNRNADSFSGDGVLHCVLRGTLGAVQAHSEAHSEVHSEAHSEAPWPGAGGASAQLIHSLLRSLHSAPRGPAPPGPALHGWSTGARVMANINVRHTSTEMTAQFMTNKCCDVNGAPLLSRPPPPPPGISDFLPADLPRALSSRHDSMFRTIMPSSIVIVVNN